MAQWARVSAIRYGGSADQDDHIATNVAEACELIDLAALDKPDLIALPECFNALGITVRPHTSLAEPIDGFTVDALRKKAKQHGCHIVCPIYLIESNQLRNAAVLIDRKGGIAGMYFKMWPTIGEIEEGVIPGTEAFVAQTDVGPIGFAICFDLNFRDVGQANRDQGARLIVFPSMYRGGISTRIWAYDFGVYLLSATPSEMSHLCDPMGRVLGDLWDYQPVMTRTINLDFEIFHIDRNQDHWKALRAAYGEHILLDIAGPEGVFLLASTHPEKTVADMIQETGMEPRHDYFRRSTLRREQALEMPPATKDGISSG